MGLLSNNYILGILLTGILVPIVHLWIKRRQAKIDQGAREASAPLEEMRRAAEAARLDAQSAREDARKAQENVLSLMNGRLDLQTKTIAENTEVLRQLVVLINQTVEHSGKRSERLYEMMNSLDKGITRLLERGV